MAKNTSILLGDYFENFIALEVKSGRYASASEVVRAALRLFEEEQNKKKNLLKELEKGEKSGMAKNFNPDKFLKSLHTKHKKNAVPGK